MSVDTARVGCFREWCVFYGIDLDGEPGSTGEEDAQAYLDDEQPHAVLDRYLLVTKAGESAHVRCFPSVEEAAATAFENVDDSIFAETPVKIVDLDGGGVWMPEWEKVAWRKQ